MSQVQPAPEFCTERQRLLDAIKVSGERITPLRSQEIEALQKGETARLQRIWKDLDNAIALHDSLVEEFNGHVQAHGCQPHTESNM